MSTNGHSSSLSSQFPKHVAIIMDGNGRWAKRRGLPRLVGHKAGAKCVRTIVEECRRIGIRYLTLFCFSTENWQRSTDEVSGLMKLFCEHLESELDSLRENGIRLRIIGDSTRLPDYVKKPLERDLENTQHNTGMDFILAMSYGSREEILQATRNIAAQVESGQLSSSAITEDVFRKNLWTSDIPDPDLLIRTSGEVRISNFLLWQIAYTEIVVAPEYWPDFTVETLHRCLEEYASRERRFGLTTEQISCLSQPENQKY